MLWGGSKPALKKTRIALERREDKRAVFWEAVVQVAVDKLVFLDECGFSLNLTRLYGWGIGGERVVEKVPLQRGKNCSVLGAFALNLPHTKPDTKPDTKPHTKPDTKPDTKTWENGLRALRHKLGAMKREDGEAFFEFDLLPVLEPGSTIVLDNAKIHRGGRLAELAHATGCSLLYLSPYSPDFAPIELAWGWLKDWVRKSAPRDNLAHAIALYQAAQLMPDFSIPWFEHCGYAIPFSD